MDSKEPSNTENWKNADLLKTELSNKKRITITIEGANTSETDTDHIEMGSKTDVQLTQNNRRLEENVFKEASTRFIDKKNFTQISKERASNEHINNQSENCDETSFSKPLKIGVEVHGKAIRDGLEKDVRPIALCEYTLHTLHIHAASSPSPSAMFRPPLSVRFWKIITDFTTAFCICVQVNRDGIFCFAFFVAFVVSASFLTAFIYRSLNVGPESSNQDIQQVKLQKVGRSDVVVS